MKLTVSRLFTVNGRFHNAQVEEVGSLEEGIAALDAILADAEAAGRIDPEAAASTAVSATSPTPTGDAPRRSGRKSKAEKEAEAAAAAAKTIEAAAAAGVIPTPAEPVAPTFAPQPVAAEPVAPTFAPQPVAAEPVAPAFATQQVAAPQPAFTPQPTFAPQPVAAPVAAPTFASAFSAPQASQFAPIVPAVLPPPPEGYLSALTVMFTGAAALDQRDGATRRGDVGNSLIAKHFPTGMNPQTAPVEILAALYTEAKGMRFGEI